MADTGRLQQERCDAPDEAEKRRRSVLVVDDDEDAHHAVRAAVGGGPLHLLSALDGGAAVRLARDLQGELVAVILDGALPDMDAEDVAEQLKVMRPRMRLVLASALPESVARRGLHPHRVCWFIEKPFTARDVAKIFDVLASAA